MNIEEAAWSSTRDEAYPCCIDLTLLIQPDEYAIDPWFEATEWNMKIDKLY